MLQTTAYQKCLARILRVVVLSAAFSLLHMTVPETAHSAPTTGSPAPAAGQPSPTIGSPGPATGQPGPTTGIPAPDSQGVLGTWFAKQILSTRSLEKLENLDCIEARDSAKNYIKIYDTDECKQALEFIQKSSRSNGPAAPQVNRAT